MKYFKCENCGGELTENAGNTYSCAYCKRTYRDDSLVAAYEKVRAVLEKTLGGALEEELLRKKNEQIANRRQSLYKARKGEFVDSEEVAYWSNEILKFLPDDPQATFYSLAATEKWSEVNRFLRAFDGKKNGYLIEDFVEFLNNGRFVERCMLQVEDLLERSLEENSQEYKNCRRAINEAALREESGTFDCELNRDVFVAYSSKDKEKVYELVEYLEENGLTCFVAMRNLAKGVDAQRYYNERLKQAMDNCQVFLFVSSKNSRSRNCDAYSIEMQYVKARDLSSSDNPNYYNNNYAAYLESYREKCKPRVEYVVEDYGSSIYETEVKKFFCGLTWCKDKEGALKAVAEYVVNVPAPVSEKDKLAREAEELKAALEVQKAELEREKAELAHRKAELERERNAEKASAATSAPSVIANQTRQSSNSSPVILERSENEAAKSSDLSDFVIKDGVLKKYKGKGGDVVIPDGVTSIGKSAFEAAYALTSVTVPEGVKEIGAYAFNGCSSLTTISTPKSLRSIGNHAFLGCKNLSNVTLGEGLHKLGESVFYGCKSLTEILLPASLAEIGNCAFWKCPDLTIHAVATEPASGWSKYWNTDQNPVVWGYKANEQTKKDSKKAEEDDKLRRLQESRARQEERIRKQREENERILQEQRDEEARASGFEIKNGVLVKYSGSDKQVVIPSAVSVIGPSAFSGRREITEVTIPASVTTIGSSAFEYCKGLKTTFIPSSVTAIGAYAFNGCSSLKITTERSRRSEGWDLKWNPDNRPVEWGDTNKTIRDKMLKPHYAWQDFKIEKGVVVKYVGEGGAVKIPDGVKEIGAKAFQGCEGLRFVEIPKGVTSIGESAFSGCNDLKNVELPATVDKVDAFAFAFCKSLTKVWLPSSVKTMERNSFSGCQKATIYHEGKTKPDGWVKSFFKSWNPDNRPVVWGATKTEFDKA